MTSFCQEFINLVNSKDPSFDPINAAVNSAIERFVLIGTIDSSSKQGYLKLLQDDKYKKHGSYSEFFDSPCFLCSVLHMGDNSNDIIIMILSMLDQVFTEIHVDDAEKRVSDLLEKAGSLQNTSDPETSAICIGIINAFNDVYSCDCVKDAFNAFKRTRGVAAAGVAAAADAVDDAAAGGTSSCMCCSCRGCCCIICCSCWG